MSLIICQQLTPTIEELLDELAKLDVARSYPNSAGSLPLLGTYGENLARRINQAQALLDRWINLMTSPDPTFRETEEKRFADYKVRGESPGVVINKALGAQTEIDIKIDTIKASITVHTPVTSTPNPSAPQPRINLPMLQLPDFDGKDQSWPSFWAAFSHSIDQNTSLTDSQKLTYLVGRLIGQARPLVEGFAIIR
jgi:hypothetical protein